MRTNECLRSHVFGWDVELLLWGPQGLMLHTSIVWDGSFFFFFFCLGLPGAPRLSYTENAPQFFVAPPRLEVLNTPDRPWSTVVDNIGHDLDHLDHIDPTFMHRMEHGVDHIDHADHVKYNSYFITPRTYYYLDHMDHDPDHIDHDVDHIDHTDHANPTSHIW